jgi:alkylated DNA repair dioxygenase AlkB
VSTAIEQQELVAQAPDLPDGMRYARELISPAEQAALLDELPKLPFKEFEFHGLLGKRRTVSFGWRYGFDGSGLEQAESIPPFLWPVRARAAAFAGREPEELEHALLIEYGAGAGIGWHRDRPVFGDVIGISLLSPCSFRLRRKVGSRWERRSLTAEPRSAYLLRGPARDEWEHSIPPLATLRYSITFRTLRADRVPAATARARD